MATPSARCLTSRLTTTSLTSRSQQLRHSKRCAFPCRQTFHSHDRPSATEPFGAADKAILSAAYRHVPEHGFSQQALRLGAYDAGLTDISPSVLSNGTFSLIHYHLVTQRLSLGDRNREHSNAKPELDVDSEVAALTWDRLMGNREIIHRWQDALAIMAQPTYASISLKEMAMLSDEILFLAGDASVDSSWYTKRAALSVVYSTSELFMTNDKSPDFVDTKDFLQRRFDNAKAANTTLYSIGQWTGFTLSAGINVLRSKGLRV